MRRRVNGHTHLAAAHARDSKDHIVADADTFADFPRQDKHRVPPRGADGAPPRQRMATLQARAVFARAYQYENAVSSSRSMPWTGARAGAKVNPHRRRVAAASARSLPALWEQRITEPADAVEPAE